MLSVPYSRSGCWTSRAGSEEGLIGRQAHLEGDLSFGADVGAARIIGRRARSDAPRRASRRVEGSGGYGRALSKS